MYVFLSPHQSCLPDRGLWLVYNVKIIFIIFFTIYDVLMNLFKCFLNRYVK